MKQNSNTVDLESSSPLLSNQRALNSHLRMPLRKKRLRIFEKFIELGLFFAAFCSVLVTIGIFWILFSEAIPFFQHVAIWDFFTGTEWAPLFSEPKYGILPLLCGTFISTFMAMVIALPMGSVIAIYLSEYAHEKIRESVKPILELLSAVPSVVFGYFALLLVTPLLQKIFPNLPSFSALSAGLVMGIMIVPYVTSLSEDALRAVPMHLREASFAMGATRFQTAIKVVFPAAFSGITASFVLAISRAIGETMVVAIAGGMQPKFTLDPFEPAQTVTAYIVQVSLGDLPHGSLGYQTIFVAGSTLLLITLFFNILGHRLRKKYKEQDA